jgi:hypothetical protein
MKDGSSGHAIIEIFNSLDQKVYFADAKIVQGVFQKSMDLTASLPDGMYVMKIIVSDVTLSKKLTIEH